MNRHTIRRVAVAMVFGAALQSAAACSASADHGVVAKHCDIQVSDAFGNTVTVAALGAANCSDIAHIIQDNLQPSFTVTPNTSRGPGTAVCVAQVSKTVFLSVISPANDSSNAVCSILPAIKQTGVQPSQQASQARQVAAQNLPSDEQNLNTDLSTLNSDLKTATQDFAKMKKDYQAEQSDYQTELDASPAGCPGGGPLWSAWEAVNNESGRVPGDGSGAGFYVTGQLQNDMSIVNPDITNFQNDILTSKTSDASYRSDLAAAKRVIGTVNKAISGFPREVSKTNKEAQQLVTEAQNYLDSKGC